ncbi:MAG: hypothetical protein AB7G88_15290, partial [Thermomicrobiales bacterium]
MNSVAVLMIPRKRGVSMEMLESAARRWIHWMFVAVGVALSILAFGLARRQTWATRLWPWDDQRMTYIFLASILMAIAVPMLWVGLTRDIAAFEPISLEIGVVSLGIGGYFALRWWRHDESDLVRHVAAAVLTGIVALVLSRLSGSIALNDRREMPRYVRISCLIFLFVLIPIGTALTVQSSDNFPWELLPQTSTVIGLIFLGSALLFAWIWFHPKWAYAEIAL